MNKRSKVLDSIHQKQFPYFQANLKVKEARQNLKDGIILTKQNFQII